MITHVRNVYIAVDRFDQRLAFIGLVRCSVEGISTGLESMFILRCVSTYSTLAESMEYVNLGSTGLKVSRICLGTMTYGSKKWREWVLEEAESRPFYPPRY